MPSNSPSPTSNNNGRSATTLNLHSLSQVHVVIRGDPIRERLSAKAEAIGFETIHIRSCRPRAKKWVTLETTGYASLTSIPATVRITSPNPCTFSTSCRETLWMTAFLTTLQIEAQGLPIILAMELALSAFSPALRLKVFLLEVQRFSASFPFVSPTRSCFLRTAPLHKL